MKKIVVICGPTASGKTGLGVSLAKKFSGEIISADSRQVYQGLTIGTGKDVGRSQFVVFTGFSGMSNKFTTGYYVIDGIRLWGLDIVQASYPFNVADYVSYVRPVLEDIWKRGKLPIIVGGTGLYIKGTVEPPKTLNVPPNRKLRRELEKLPRELLEARLKKTDSSRWRKMNASDRINPRRLIRAIEIASFADSPGRTRTRLPASALDVLKIGLNMPRDGLYKRIDERVDKRISLGMEKEVRRLLSSGVPRQSQAFSATGYREFIESFPSSTSRLGKGTLPEIIQRWKFAEHNYARNQLTWFRKDKEIIWYDVSSPGWQEKVVKRISRWYN